MVEFEIVPANAPYLQQPACFCGCSDRWSLIPLPIVVKSASEHGSSCTSEFRSEIDAPILYTSHDYLPLI